MLRFLRDRFIRGVALLLISLALPCTTHARNLSPLDFGLRLAQTATERYAVLYKTHQKAVEYGCGVSYQGIERIEIEIPKDAKSIPLPMYTNFAGVELVVTNNEQNMPLFAKENKMKPIEVQPSRIDNGIFMFDKTLGMGKKLLVVEDETPWVKQRRGYKYGATRKDVLLLKYGWATNRVISSYSTKESNPKCYYCDVTGQKVVIKDLIFTRKSESKKITRFVSLRNLNDISISNVEINTPEESILYGESAIYISNSANVTLKDVTINGTYSLKDKYGYGIEMNNVWNSRFVRLKATGNWGVFGNNNINKATLEDCEINRFDVHCYGKDVSCKNTTFRDLYNQFSSLYGTLKFKKCRFIGFVPVLLESSYSAYTPFDLELIDCVIDVKKCPYLINAGNPALLSGESRQELSEIRFPNVTIRNTIVNLPKGQSTWIIFHLNTSMIPTVSGLLTIDMNGLKIKSSEKNTRVLLTDKAVCFEKEIKAIVKRSDISTIYGVE